jgi:curved DNA-binding protein CbpA
MNPYDVLGVPPSASDDQLRSAYRKLARSTHPDSGGNGDEFAQVSRAYAILRDPEMRKRFDETGSIDEVSPLTVRQRMIQIIADMFSNALAVEGQRGTSLRHFPLIKAMRKQITQNSERVRQNAATYKKALEDRQFLLARITRKDYGENLFADIIRNQIKEIEPIVRASALDVAAMDMATEELLHYDNEVDLIQAVQMMQYGGNFAAQNQTGTSVFFFSNSTNGGRW